MRKYPKSPYTMSDTLRRMDNEYNGRYRGTVLDNEDPDERGRCKVFVYGIYDESLKEDKGKRLPWAEPCQPLFCGGMGNDGANGTFQLPDLNSTVYVFFDSGDITRPVMFGQTTDKNGKFSTKHCKFKWEKMYIDLCRDKEAGTNVISISADTDINETANTNNYNLSAGNFINDVAQVTVNITALDKDINEKAGVDVNVEALSGNVNIKAAKKVTIEAGEEVIITAPKVTINGETTINGTCHITDATTIDSTTTIQSSTTINSSLKVASDANIGGKSFLGHIHTGDGGPEVGTTSPPL